MEPRPGRAGTALYRCLPGHPAVCPPKIDPANEHIFHQYTIRVPRRDELQAHLKASGIGHAVYYPLALHLQPCFAHLGYERGTLPVTEAAMDSVLSLPIFPELTSSNRTPSSRRSAFYD